MKKRTLKLAFLLIVFSLILAACGGGTDKQGESGGEQSTGITIPLPRNLSN